MGKRYEAITPELAQWIGAQPLFFVATAPLAADGHVNVSPKGLDTLRILDAGADRLSRRQRRASSPLHRPNGTRCGRASRTTWARAPSSM